MREVFLMFCQSCLEKSITKLLPNDIVVLEYLLKQNATIAQCAISREVIKDENDLSIYKCYTALERLECFGMVDKQSRSKTSKYYITDAGKFVLNTIENKIGEAIQ
jgi:Fe2+ or Zn2+ uptake regulation protein